MKKQNIFISCIEWCKNLFRRKERRVSDISLDTEEDEYNYNLL